MGNLSLGETAAEEWQLATALALAYLRQQTELYDVLEPVYQSGVGKVSSDLLQRAVRAVVLRHGLSEFGRLEKESVVSPEEVSRRIPAIALSSSDIAKLQMSSNTTHRETAVTLLKSPSRLLEKLPSTRRPSLDALKVPRSSLPRLSLTLLIVAGRVCARRPRLSRFCAQGESAEGMRPVSRRNQARRPIGLLFGDYLDAGKRQRSCSWRRRLEKRRRCEPSTSPHRCYLPD